MIESKMCALISCTVVCSVSEVNVKYSKFSILIVIKCQALKLRFCSYSVL